MIDTASEPGSYADLLRFPPWIADERDGTIFRNWTPLGAQGGGLTTASLRPTVPLKGCFDAGEGSNDAALSAQFLSHHADGDTDV